MSIENKESLPEIRIVDEKPEDAQGVAEVFYKAWLATYPNEKFGITVDDIEDQFKDSFTEEGLAKQAERITRVSENISYSVAKDGDKVVGVCRAMRNPDNNQLKAIYILPEYQGKGIGKLFWEEAQKHFDPDKDTIVHVATYNTNAIDFYKKIGFTETGKEFSDERFKMKSGAIMPETEMIIKNETRDLIPLNFIHAQKKTRKVFGELFLSRAKYLTGSFFVGVAGIGPATSPM